MAILFLSGHNFVGIMDERVQVADDLWKPQHALTPLDICRRTSANHLEYIQIHLSGRNDWILSVAPYWPRSQPHNICSITMQNFKHVELL